MPPVHETETFDLGPVVVTVVLDAGPRVLGYSRHNGPQVFADLPGDEIPRRDGPPFEFIGGHRLWRAPEVPAVTYRPDGAPVAIDRDGDVVHIGGAADDDGIVKAIALWQHGTVTVVDHTILNGGDRPIRCAPWAITQLAPGGTAVLPQPSGPADPDGVLPNRTIVLWPYTDPSSPEIGIRPDEVSIYATGAMARTKVGQPNRRGWTAYHLDDEVFVKWSPLHDDSLDYADLGASVECYRDHRFLELESLGPLTDLEPGGSIQHREAWTLIPLDGGPRDEVLASLPERPAELIG